MLYLTQNLLVKQYVFYLSIYVTVRGQQYAPKLNMIHNIIMASIAIKSIEDHF